MTSTEPHPDIFSEHADDPVSEALLLQAVRDGSTAAFGILYARYRSSAVSVARQTLPHADVALAEDVAEVSFIRVLTALRNGKGPSDTMRAYLSTTVRREAWRAQRRRRRQAEVAERWAAGEERAVEPDTEPRLELDDADLGAHVLLGQAFRGLSDRWRHVLWLTAVEGRKPAEVAPMLGLSAGSASALAYRARLGLIAAYVAAYRRSTDDEACVEISGRLEQYVAAGTPPEGFDDVVAHLDGCPSCRELSRGVDVLGTVLASMAPFGLLTAGWWAKSAGIGAAGLAGSAAAGTLGASQGLGAGAGTAATGGIGVGGAVAAAAAVVVLAGAAWFGVARSDPEPTHGAAPPAEVPTTSARIRVETTDDPGAPTPTSAAVPSAGGPDTVPAEPVVSAPIGSTTSPLEAGPASVPSTSSVPASTAPTSSPSTSPPSTSTSLSGSTTTTVPPVEDPGVLSGRATKTDEQGESAQIPVAGIGVVAYDDQGRLAGSSATGKDGRWSLRSLPDGTYLVVAVVPAAYRPATGEDPWQGGDTWGVILGSVEVHGQQVDLVDLRLLDR